MAGDNDAFFDRIRRVVERCESNHTCVPQTAELPTRVLDLGVGPETPSTVVLVETKGRTGRYIALSHCWGGSLTLKTTNDNYSDHLLGIPIDYLTPKYRDAVRLTKLLGQRYLWIDSLCIIQGNTADWACEASRMAGV